VQKHILIGDDNPLIRKTLRQFLEKQDGWVVVGEADNGKEAVEKALELKPDLVVLDISMPVMNGLDAARELRRLLPSIPLIIFTSFKSDQVNHLALSAGASAVVSKCEPESLVRHIHSLLESPARSTPNPLSA